MTVSEPTGASDALQDAEPPESGWVVHKVVEPSLKVTVPVGVPVDPLVASVTLAEYVTDVPKVGDAEDTDTAVALDAGVTVRLAVPEDVVKPVSPEYVPVTVCVPTGTIEEVHDPIPLARVAVVHPVVESTLKVTVPVGVAVDPLVASVTLAE